MSKYDFNFTFGGGAMASIWPKEEDDLEVCGLFLTYFNVTSSVLEKNTR